MGDQTQYSYGGGAGGVQNWQNAVATNLTLDGNAGGGYNYEQFAGMTGPYYAAGYSPAGLSAYGWDSRPYTALGWGPYADPFQGQYAGYPGGPAAQPPQAPTGAQPPGY
jgi:hypothetical protein